MSRIVAAPRVQSKQLRSLLGSANWRMEHVGSILRECIAESYLTLTAVDLLTRLDWVEFTTT
jgi:hypothetical protein